MLSPMMHCTSYASLSPMWLLLQGCLSLSSDPSSLQKATVTFGRRGKGEGLCQGYQPLRTHSSVPCL